jgi:hypothetical protein
VYRTNTFPLVHAGFFHAFFNILALTPLLERFEAEYGTLTTLALFMGREYLLRSLDLWIRCIVADLDESFIYDPGIDIYVHGKGDLSHEHYNPGSEVRPFYLSI